MFGAFPTSGGGPPVVAQIITLHAFSGLLVDDGGGGAETWFASDIGVQQVNPSVLAPDSAIGYPISAHLVSRLRACAPIGTSSALTFTVYKNGVATAITCTIPGGSPAYSKVRRRGGILFLIYDL